MDARKWTVCAGLGAAFLCSSPAHAFPDRVATPWAAASFDSSRRIDFNDVDMAVDNDGTIANDRATGTADLVFPKGSGKTARYTGGPWIVAKVNGAWRGAICEFASEFAPGAMANGAFTDPLNPRYRTYKVQRFTGQPTDTAHIEYVVPVPVGPSGRAIRAALGPRDPLVHHSWSEYVAGAAPDGAPTRIYRLPLTSTPDPTDSVDVPGPDVMGDQMLWCVYNDADPARHQVRSGNTAPLGVQIQQSVYAFLDGGALDRTIFMRLRIANLGANTLDSLFVGWFGDPDLGGAEDDHIGSDSTRALVYCYNGHYRDYVYGDTPPAIGYVLLRGPVVAGTLGPSALTGPFKGYEEPQNILESVNWVQGRLKSGLPFLDPEGQPSRFWYSSDPVRGTGWLDPLFADRRMMLSTGPITMAPGDTQVVDLAIVIGQGEDNLASVANLRCAVDAVRAFYTSGFLRTGSPIGAGCPTTAVESCPKSVAYWQDQCASGGLSASDVTRIAQCVDESASTLSFTPGMELQQFCAALNADPSDPRIAVETEYLTFLANVCAARLGLAGADSAFLGEKIELWSPLVGATNAGQLAASAWITPCFCADSLLIALQYQGSGPAVLATYQVLLGELASLNAGIGIGPTCAEDPRTRPVLVSADPAPGHVDLAWDLRSGAFLPVAIERTSGQTWTRIWQGPSTGSELHFTDRNVPGGSYAYRLVLNAGGREDPFAETQVEVPRVPQTTLRVLRNPTPGSLVIRFTLLSAAPATVEIYDLRGRLRASHRITNPAIGSQVLDLGSDLEVGLYMVRLRQAGQSASAKAVITR